MQVQLVQYISIFSAISGLVFIIYKYLRSLTHFSNALDATFWEFQPWVGLKKQMFSQMRASFRSVKHSQSMVAEGYAKFSKSNRHFVLPSMGSKSVIIPPLQLHKILNKPEDEIEAMDSQNETLQASYTIQDKEIYVNSIHFNVVNKQLTRDIPSFIESIAEELALGFERYWGTSTEWKTVGAWDTCQKIVARTANRVFLGTALCRNDVFLDHSRKYALSVFGGGIVINTTPSILKPILGYLIGLEANRHLAVCKKILIPVVEERLKNTIQLSNDPDFKWTPPYDALQWIIEECEKTTDPKQFNPALIAHRLMMLNLVSVHTTSNTLINVILDLYSSPPSSGFLDGLYEECTRVLADSDGVWTKHAVSQLYRVDSTIRESMRFSAFGIVALPRRVNSPEGLELDDKSILPKGVRLTFPMQAIHQDEAFYPNAQKFDAFRFSRPYETKRADINRKFESGDTITDTFLAFGNGRHACPGRFFAMHEMKLMVAHVVQNYEVEYMPTRPPMEHLMELKYPAIATQIRVRRKKSVGLK